MLWSYFFYYSSLFIWSSDCYEIIQSDTASVSVPELELELTSGTLGGIVTTVEGLITKIGESKCIHELLSCCYLQLLFLSRWLISPIADLERVQGFTLGDSSDECERKKWCDFKSRLDRVYVYFVWCITILFLRRHLALRTFFPAFIFLPF